VNSHDVLKLPIAVFEKCLVLTTFIALVQFWICVFTIIQG